MVNSKVTYAYLFRYLTNLVSGLSCKRARKDLRLIIAFLNQSTCLLGVRHNL